MFILLIHIIDKGWFVNMFSQFKMLIRQKNLYISWKPPIEDQRISDEFNSYNSIMLKWYQKILKTKYENKDVKHENEEEKITFSQQKKSEANP